MAPYVHFPKNPPKVYFRIPYFSKQDFILFSYFFYIIHIHNHTPTSREVFQEGGYFGYPRWGV